MQKNTKIPVRVLEFRTVIKARFAVICFLITSCLVFLGGYISVSLENIWLGLFFLPFSFGLAVTAGHLLSKGTGKIELHKDTHICINGRQIFHKSITGWYLNQKAVSISSIRLFLIDGSFLSIDGPVSGNDGIHFERCAMKLFEYLDTVAINRLEILKARGKLKKLNT